MALLFLAAVVFAEPEAKPEADAAADAWYAYYGHPGYYGGWGGYYGGYYRGWGGYYGYPGYGYRYLWKRDAEADEAPAQEEQAGPSADPQLFYANYYTHGLYNPYYYAPSTYYTYSHPVTYTHATVAAPYRYYANSAGVVHAVAKRDAEPEAEPKAEPYWPYYGWGYRRGYYGYGRPWGYRGWWY